MDVSLDVVRRVSWLELFFDLVFVAAVAQVATPLAHEFSAAEVFRFALLFILIWWAWLGHTIFATRFGRDGRAERALTFLQICAAAAMAVNSQGALSSRDSAGFAAAYGLMRLLLAAQYARVRAPAAATLVRRYMAACALSAALWLASSLLPPPLRFVLWAVAFLVDALTPVTAERHGTRVPPHAEHLPERFGLFTIILLGEAMASVMRGMQQHETWPPAAALAVASGLAVVFQVWWWYFHTIGAAAPRRIRSRRQAHRLLAWSYAHVPLYVGLVVLGVGFEHVIVSTRTLPDPMFVAETAAAAVLVALSLALLRWLVSRSGHSSLGGLEPDFRMRPVAERLLR
jgi:low temperature requirement protein LtrA